MKLKKNKILSVIISVLILYQNVESRCGPGTLKCINPESELNSKAIMCDPSLKYVLNENTCTPENISNCLLSLNPGSCRVCKFGYYLTNDRKCAEVPRYSPSSITGCNFYESIDSCKACNLTSYKRNGICRPGSLEIQGCSLMDDKKKCKICDLGIPTYNQTYCNAPNINKFFNCLLIRHPLSCKQCKPGYTKDKNYFLSFLSDNKIQKDFFEKIGFWRHNFFDIVHNVPSCKFEYSIDNCQDLDYNNYCSKCIDGYTLSPDRRRCFVKPTPPLNPKKRIPNCFKFATENYEQCEICFEGYFLKDDNTKCVRHSETITGCNVYSQTQENKCVFCVNTEFRGTSNEVHLQCGTRSNYFQNCERYSRSSDKCLECAQDHIFHFENKRCSREIEFCQVPNTDFRILQCSDCIDSHYLNNDDTLCFNANNSIFGCEKYDKGPSCQKCKQGFYLDPDTKTCLFHNTFLECKLLSIITKDVCDECNKEGVRTVKTHECLPVPAASLAADPYCTNWNENLSCIECQTDYVLKMTEVENEDTGLIETIKLCQQEKGCILWKDIDGNANETGCYECQDGYFLHEYTCNKSNTEFCVYSYESAVLRYNYAVGSNLEGGFPCEICDEERMFLVDLSDPEFRCIKTSFFTDAQLIDNCMSYEKDDTLGYKCLQCQRNFEITPDGTACNEYLYTIEETFYADKETRVTRTGNYTNAVTVDDEAPVNWPLNYMAIHYCDVLGPGGKYCMQKRDSIIYSNDPNVEDNVRQLAPIFNLSTFANYTTDYIIDPDVTTDGALDLEDFLPPTVKNYTTFKYYIEDFDATGNRKSQEPYIWYDTMPMERVFFKHAQVFGFGDTISTDHQDYKRIVLFVDGQDRRRYTTVCNNKIFKVDDNTRWKTQFSNLTIWMDTELIKEDIVIPGDADNPDVTFKSPFAEMEKFRETKITANDYYYPMVYPCDSQNPIDNCIKQNSVIMEKERYLTYLSCDKCDEGYLLRQTIWRYRNYLDPDINTYLHQVAETDCVENQPNNNVGDQRLNFVENCYFYERVLHHVNSDIIHYCKECSEGSYPIKQPEQPRCAIPCSEFVDEDDPNTANYTYKCDDWYRCSIACPADVCDFTEKICDTAGANLSCIPHDCCITYDDEGNCTESKENDLTTCDSLTTRGRAVPIACVDNCQGPDGEDLLLTCDEATYRCIPAPCDPEDCDCFEGECKDDYKCRSCTPEGTGGEFCSNEGGVAACAEFKFCNDPDDADNQCEPACVATDNCTLASMDIPDANSAHCNFFNGECTVTKKVMNFVCACNEFNEIKVAKKAAAAPYIIKNYYISQCIDLIAEETHNKWADFPCICLGSGAPGDYGDLDKCPDPAIPVWDTDNHASCRSLTKVQATNATSKNACNFTKYKSYKEEHAAFVAAADGGGGGAGSRVKNSKSKEYQNLLNHEFENSKRILNAGSGGGTGGGTGGGGSTAAPLTCGLATTYDECVDSFADLNANHYILKSAYDAILVADDTIIPGGCLHQCTMVLEEYERPVNHYFSDPDNINCYGNCFTDSATSPERCDTTTQKCERICDLKENGITTNCQKNEICVVNASDTTQNTCEPIECSPKCNEYYETCDIATNQCNLIPKKPVKQIIVECKKVENCDLKYYLNKCNICLNNYSFKVDPTGNTADTVDLAEPIFDESVIPECVQSKISNAIYASEFTDADGIVSYRVEKCKNGYNIDYNNNLCVSSVKNCKLFSPEGDCLGCDTPYKTATIQLVHGVFEKGFCKTYEEIELIDTIDMTPYDAVYNENCKYYQYKYTSNNPSDVNSLTDGESHCVVCKDEFYFSDVPEPDSCGPKRTENCETYDTSDNSGRCTACLAGYEILNQGAPTQECKKIENNITKIKGCALYDADLNCLECEPEYFWRATGEDSNQTGFCFEKFPDDTCAIQDASIFETDGIIQCSKCTKVRGIFYSPRLQNTPTNVCVFFLARNLCVSHEFDKADSLALTNPFTCKLCDSDYYLSDSGVCIRRINTGIKNCVEYNPTADSCSKFESSSVDFGGNDEFSNELPSDQTLILNPPDYSEVEEKASFGGWIMGCEVYKNETACERCYANKFINQFGFEYNTKCIFSENFIENCVYYSDNKICGECYPGFMLVNNECKLITVENCATYHSHEECATCPLEFPYIDEDGNCRRDPRNLFCITYALSNDTLNLQANRIFECDICLENFYPDDSAICTKVESFIQGCKYYAGDGLCKECDDGLYLNYDGKKCIINPSFDPFCKTFSFLSECSVCEPGHYIDDDGFCVACDPEFFPEGCQYCDPSDNSICLACKFGYEDTVDGCIKNENAPIDSFIRPYRYFIDQENTQIIEAQSGVANKSKQ